LLPLRVLDRALRPVARLRLARSAILLLSFAGGTLL